jgi:hypothetical protein
METVMPKKPSHGRFKLAAERNSLDTKSQELFTEVGRAIVQLSNIENALADIYYSLINHRVTTLTSMNLFYAQTWFDNKVMLVDLLFGLEGTKEQIGRWQKIVAELKTHRGVRNLIAHQGMYIGFPDKEGLIDVSLHPPPLRIKYDPKAEHFVPSKGRHLGIAEIRSTASALSRIHHELEKFWQEIEDSFLPEAQRSDYVDKDEED